MAKLILRQDAIDDLNNIWDYTFYKWSEKQADKYYNSIKMACHAIADNPYLGNRYNAISKSLLGYKVGKHIVFYHLLSENEIEVIRILHQQMDLEKQL